MNQVDALQRPELGEHTVMERDIRPGRAEKQGVAARLEHLDGVSTGPVLLPSGGGRDRPLNLRGVLLRHRLIPTVRLLAAEDAVPLAEALQRAGLPLIQVSLATSAARASPDSLASRAFSSSIYGIRCATACFITRADLTTCGKNILPAPNKSPTMFIPSISGPSIT